MDDKLDVTNCSLRRSNVRLFSLIINPVAVIHCALDWAASCCLLRVCSRLVSLNDVVSFTCDQNAWSSTFYDFRHS